MFPPERKPERGYVRQNHPFGNRPFISQWPFWCWQKGGFQEGGFGGCSPGTKTGTRVRSPKPPFYETALISPSEFWKAIVSKNVVSWFPWFSWFTVFPFSKHSFYSTQIFWWQSRGTGRQLEKITWQSVPLALLFFFCFLFTCFLGKSWERRGGSLWQ